MNVEEEQVNHKQAKLTIAHIVVGQQRQINHFHTPINLE